MRESGGQPGVPAIRRRIRTPGKRARSYPDGSAATMSCFDATSISRLKTPELVRHNSNAWAEVAAVNRCARFPAFTASACSYGGGLSGTPGADDRIRFGRGLMRGYTIEPVIIDYGRSIPTEECVAAKPRFSIWISAMSALSLIYRTRTFDQANRDKLFAMLSNLKPLRVR